MQSYYHGLVINGGNEQPSGGESIHLDGNKSHPVETMTLFGRISVNLKRMNVEMMKEFDHRYLLLPLEGVTIKLRCGFDIVHCSLKKTVHLADNSRNTCNWSRVHDP